MSLIDWANLNAAEEDRTEEIANQRWLTLRQLSTKAEVVELREAGVAQHTIDRLYEVEFEELLSGIMDLIDDDSLRHLDGTERWGDESRELEGLVRNLPYLVRKFCTASFKAFVGTQDYLNLSDHIFNRLRTGEAMVPRTESMIRCLWYTCWMMAHISDTDSQWQVRHRFVKVTDWVLPQLKA